MIYNTECNTRAPEHQVQSQVEEQSRGLPERIVLKPLEPQHWPFLFWKFKGHSHMMLVWMLPSFFLNAFTIYETMFSGKRQIYIKAVGYFHSTAEELQYKYYRMFFFFLKVFLDAN